MLINEFFNIKNQIIQYNKLSSLSDLSFELTACHASFRYDIRHLCTKLTLVPDLARDEPNEEEGTRGTC